MARLIKFVYNKKEYEILNKWIPVIEDETLTEEAIEKIIIDIIKKRISSHNRSEAQKERWKKQKEAEILGIPYVPKTKRKIIAENLNPKNNVNLNSGLFKKHKKFL